MRAIAYCVPVCVMWGLWSLGGGQICLHRGALRLQLHQAFAAVTVATITLRISSAVISLIMVSVLLKRGGEYKALGCGRSRVDRGFRFPPPW